MSIELTLLIWSAALAGAYIGVQAILYRIDYGVVHAASARDGYRPPGVMAGRAERALRNFLETYGVFIALALAIELSGRSDGLTQWGAQIWFWARLVYIPAYVGGVPFVRSMIWLVSGLGLGLMLLGVAF